jgi:hypothetical protein
MTGHRLSTPIAWALVVLALILGHFGIANPLLTLYAERQSRIDVLGEMVSARSAMIARGDALVERRKALKQLGNGLTSILSARDTTAVAQLQEYLRVAANAQGLRVDTLRVLADRKVDPLRIVAVRASLSGSVDQAQRLLHGLESGIPMIRVSHLALLGRPGVADLEITLEIAALAESPTNAD